jgi:TRAP-type uncharacterized transport system substrate-binding protein
MKKKIKLKKKNEYFDEAYTIKAIYQDNDGFWKYINETQLVPVKHGINEKDNHQKAGELFLKERKELKNLQIKSIIYQ